MRTTANFATNQRPENWRETILMLYPNVAGLRKAPLTALTAAMKERKVDDPVFHWWEKELNNRRFLLTADLGAAAGGAAGSLTVDASYNPSTGVKKNEVLMVEATGEILIVSADPSATNTIPVLRGANTGGAGLAVTLITAGTNPYVMVIGSAFEEGSDAPTGVNFDPLERSNYTQIFRSTLEYTRTAERTRLRTGDAIKEAKRECLEYFSIDMERAFWFGKKGSGTVNGKPRRMTSGVIEQIQTVASANVITADATTGADMDWLMSTMATIFAFGSSEKVMFGGNSALLTINEIVRKNSSMHIQTGIKEYGMNVSRLTSPFGELVFVGHPLFQQMGGGTVGGTKFYGYDATSVILDMQFVQYTYIDDVQYQPELTNKGLDGEKSGYLAECGMEINFPKTHFIIKNLAKAKKDA